MLGAGLAAIIYEFIFAVNATPAKAAGYITPSYNEDDYDNYGRKSGAMSNPTEMA